MKSKQNFLKNEKSDWSIELDLLEQNSHLTDLREAVDATFKATGLVAKVLKNPSNTDIIRKIDRLESEQKDREDRAWKRGNYIEINNEDF